MSVIFCVCKLNILVNTQCWNVIFEIPSSELESVSIVQNVMENGYAIPLWPLPK